MTQSDGIDEAISSPVFLSGPDGTPKARLITPLDNGWAILPHSGTTNGWDIASAEYSTVDYRPELIVTFITTGFYRPVADAGDDQTLADADGDGEELITLNGSGSYPPESPDKFIVQSSYTWVVDDDLTQTYTGSYVEDVVLAVGVHTVTLTVMDNDGVTDTDTVTIAVNANQAPIADAGGDQTAEDLDGDGYETITLNGQGSSDPDGNIVSYVWTVVDQLGIEVATGEESSITVTLALGEYTAYLTVTDDAGEMGTDTITLTVEEPSLFADDFESGSFSAGGWTATAQASVETGAAYIGTYGALLKKASSLQKTIDTTGVSAANFSYCSKTEGLNKGSFHL